MYSSCVGFAGALGAAGSCLSVGADELAAPFSGDL
jgi:hypothetical protein